MCNTSTQHQKDQIKWEREDRKMHVSCYVQTKTAMIAKKAIYDLQFHTVCIFHDGTCKNQRFSLRCYSTCACKLTWNKQKIDESVGTLSTNLCKMYTQHRRSSKMRKQKGQSVIIVKCTFRITCNIRQHNIDWGSSC